MTRRYRPRDLGNSIAMVIMLLPLLIGAFGLGFDMSYNTYTRTRLQGAVDHAAANAVPLSLEGTGRALHISPPEARANARAIYMGNRDYIGNLIGNTPGDFHADVNGDVLTIRVEEASRNVFVRMLGITTQPYTVEARATLARYQY